MRSPIFLIGQASLVLIIFSASLGCAASWPQVTSFSDFRSCQESYCQGLVDFLNRPIDWHVVVDVSGSYLKNDGSIADKVLILISTLPLRDGDQLTIDEFSDDLFKSDSHQTVAADWIQRLKGGAVENLNSAQGDIWHLLVRSDDKPPFPSGKTDIAGLFANKRSSIVGYSDHSSHGTEARLTYYIILTDGVNDPHGTGSHVPLFVADDFFEALDSFTSGGTTALLLLLDLRPQSLLKAPTPVQKDWGNGMRRISEVNKQEPRRLLHAARWNLGFFTDSMKRQIGRLGGIYPCVVATSDSSVGPAVWKPGRWPTVTGFPYDKELPSACKSLKLEVPEDLANGDKESSNLPLALLASGTSSTGLFVSYRLNGMTHEQLSERFDSHGDTYGGWKYIFHPIQVPSFEDDPNSNLPWIEVRFDNQKEQHPFFEAQLVEPSIFSAATAALYSMRSHGKLFALLAVLFWVGSLLSAWYYAERVAIFVEIEEARAGSKTALKSGRRLYGRRQFRFRHPKNGGKKIKEVVREDWPHPNWAKNDYIVFDVIPIFNVVYHLIYYMDGSRQPSADDGCDLLSLSVDRNGNEDSFLGAFYRARTFWHSSEKPWQVCRHKWQETIENPKPPVGFANQFAKPKYSVTTTIEEDQVACFSRVVSVLLSSLALTFSAAAITRSLSRSAGIIWPMMSCLIVALLVYLMRYWPAKSNRKKKVWLWVDSLCTFSLHALLATALFVAFFGGNSASRLTIILLIVLGCALAVPLYERMRDQLVRSRIANRQPVNVWDFLLEIFLARLCS